MKGQASLEFLIFASILILMLSVYFWSSSSFQQRVNRIKSIEEAQRLCDKIAFEINLAVRAGDGYRRKFYVDENLYGIGDFDIRVANNTVFLDWNEGSVSSSIITKNIVGTIEKGDNLIENRGGTIYVS